MRIADADVLAVFVINNSGGVDLKKEREIDLAGQCFLTWVTRYRLDYILGRSVNGQTVVDDDFVDHSGFFEACERLQRYAS